MELFNSFYTISQQSDADKPSLFPFPFSMHLIFVCISVLFFVYRFSAQKRPYQIIMAAAIFISMGVWISDNRTLYYVIGAIELGLILCAIVLSFIFREKKTDELSDKDKKDGGDDDNDDKDDNSDDGDSDEDEEDEETLLNAANTINSLLN